MKTVSKLISGIIASVMTVTALPVQLFASAADQTKEITKIELFGINESLIEGEAPSFTAHLSDESAAQMTLANEAWVNIDTDDACLRSGGEVIPVSEEGAEPAYYSYYIQLVPKSGYEFPEYFTLFYEGWEVSMMDYDVIAETSYIAIRCDFIGAVTPSAGTKTLSSIELENVQLTFSAGDAPAFSGTPAPGSHLSVVTEGWSGGGARIMRDAAYNDEELREGDALLTSFAAGTEYTYLVWIEPDAGYTLGESPRLIVNGREYGYTYSVMQSWIDFRTALRITVTAPETTPPVTSRPGATTAVTKAQTTAPPATTVSKNTTASATTKTAATTKNASTTAAAVTTSAGTVPEIPGVMFGDVNLDGRISISDVILLLRLMTEEGGVQIEANGIYATDADRNGIVTMGDVMVLLRLISGQTEITDKIRNTSMPFSDPKAVTQKPVFHTRLAESDGNSTAFTANPLPGLTVSAEKDALHYDGQLTFSPLTDDDLPLYDKLSDEMGIDMLGGWHVDAGLKADEFLPGTFRSEFDLNELEVSEDLYDNIRVVRYDDEGGITFYSAERDGSVISWDSAQNSVICICVLVASMIVTIGANAMHCMMLAYIAGVVMLGSVAWLYDEQSMKPAQIWAKDEVQSLVCYEHDHFYIWYADPDAKERNLRIKNAEEQARAQVKAEIEKEYDDLS